MLTSLISFLYEIKVDCLRKNGNGYVFFYNNNFYIFKETVLNEDNIVYLNQFIDDRVGFHILIKNRYNRFLSAFNNKNFILMRVRFKENRLLLLDDIYINNSVISYVKRDDFNWVNLWKKKIFQVEVYLSDNVVGIYELAIINYYLELWDIAEYIKCDIYSDKEIELNKYKILNKVVDKELLISRLLFPSYFFDVIDEFIVGNKNFKDFSNYFINMDIYEQNLLKIIEFITK